jgi:hypothetical protein
MYVLLREVRQVLVPLTLSLVHLWGMSFNGSINLSLMYELQYLQHIGKFT